MPFISVTDNGVGLPKENRHRLTEPYMTTRVKGTGLGLAIVKRIMEEHGGRVMLDDAPEEFDNGHGARITLSFMPLLEEQIAVTA
jgi:two-component system nitrogen regulation sensor histidine kinase NtrY